LFIAALLCSAISRSEGAILGVDILGGSPSWSTGDYTIGWEFNITTSKVVTALGVFDENGDGLFGHLSQEVAIWNASGASPLAQVTITNASTVVASVDTGAPFYPGRWLFENLSAPIVLSPGNYVLGVDNGGDDSWLAGRFNPTLFLAPDVTYLRFRYSSSPTPGLDFPDGISVTRDVGFFGPNLLLEDVAAVPEPASLALWGLGALGCAIGAYRRRKSAQQTGHA